MVSADGVALVGSNVYISYLHPGRAEIFWGNIKMYLHFSSNFSTLSWDRLLKSVLSENKHYNDVIMGMMAFQKTSPIIVYSTVYSGADQRKHQSSASLAFVRGIQWWPLDSPHKEPITWKMFPFDDVVMGHPYPTLTGLHFAHFQNNNLL